MNTPLWINSSLVLDARRAVWLPKEATLAAADLSLGNPSSSSSPKKKKSETVAASQGEEALLQTAAEVLGMEEKGVHPASAQETVARLLALCADYQPKQIVLMGELIHPEADREALIPLLKALFDALRERAALVLVGDDLDKELDAFLERCDWHAGVVPIWPCGDIALTHGRVAPEALAQAQDEGKQIVLGFENPTVSLRRGSTKYPCFVLGAKMVLLPSFDTELPGHDLWESPHIVAVMKRTPFDFTVSIRKKALVPAKLRRRVRRSP